MPTKGKATKSQVSEQALNKGLRSIRASTSLAGIPKDLDSLTRRKKLAIFRKYKAVADGTAHVVKLSPEMAQRYESAHLKAVRSIGGNQVIVPVEPGFTKTKVIRGEPILKGAISQTRKLRSGELEVVILPYPLDRITDFVKDAKKHPQWDRLKATTDKWRFGFGDGSIEGTNWSGFRAGKLADVAEYLQGYAQIQNGMSRKQDRTMMQALVIVRTRGNNEEIEERRSEQKQHKIDRNKRIQRERYARLRKERGG